MIEIQLTPMTTMLGVINSHHCKPDQTHCLWDAYTESDAQKASVHAKTIKNHLCGANAGKLFIRIS